VLKESNESSGACRPYPDPQPLTAREKPMLVKESVTPEPRSLTLCVLSLATAALLAAFPGEAAAADLFPRGPGFYFSIPALVVTLLLYLLWVRTCWWVDKDCKSVGMPAWTWNPLMWGAGLIGFLVIWLLPIVLVSFCVFLALFLTTTLAYVNLRNQKVPDGEKVLTKRHLQELAERYLKLRFGPKFEEKSLGPPIRFMARGTNRTDDDPALVARAEGSKGYRAALEMVYEAIQNRSTDIHMEPTRTQMTVRFRVDGVLQPADPFNRTMGDAVVNIFKVLCNMDIIEKRKPQDGSYSAECEGRVIDFRVATAGSVAGEKLVMRIFDRGQQITSLAQLGMDDKMHEKIYGLVTQPHGMLIVCGPTGAGKSTTLYSSLNEIDRYQKNVITVENPVECQVTNVTQIEINPKTGKTFATELRSILRQDPDVIMIGEIRDQETAEIACQAAQTGHMVFTTLHANDSVTAVIRLLDLGVQPATMASAISAVLAQRLVRALCPKCKVRYKPNPEMLRKANLPVDKIKYFYRPPEPDELQQEDGEEVVCENCGGAGYKGRTGIFELLVVNDRIRDLVRENPNMNAIKQEAIKNGLRFLQEDGLRQVIAGKTSIQEVLRVCK
jgi:type II secretory ATPase GspE/PulE/Tfp pilus assembly ATPase PilB-like protein